VLALGRDLGLVTVAEGVESREGWDLLTALGCDQAQGFVVCPPLTSSQFGDWLDRRQPEEFAYLDRPPDDLISITEADIEAIGTEADPEVEVDTGAADPDDT
jgi:predicted signal transduction protein with EAL and GGDEF domain